MNSLTKAFTMLVMISLVGFTYISDGKGIIKPFELENINENESFTNSSLVEFIDKGTMKTSWYGPRFHGRKTANGEVFDQMAFTAAHKKMKFGTILRITNPKNNKSVVVRINDRGPYAFGRQLDLSKAAALELEIIEKGVAKLNVEEITLKGVNLPVITLN